VKIYLFEDFRGSGAQCSGLLRLDLALTMLHSAEQKASSPRCPPLCPMMVILRTISKVLMSSIIAIPD